MIPTTKQINASRKAAKIPEGWHTRQEIMHAWGLSPAYTAKLIRESIENGRCAVRKFTILTRSRGIYPTQHYKFKKG